MYIELVCQVKISRTKKSPLSTVKFTFGSRIFFRLWRGAFSLLLALLPDLPPLRGGGGGGGGGRDQQTLQALPDVAGLLLQVQARFQGFNLKIHRLTQTKFSAKTYFFNYIKKEIVMIFI